MLERARVEQIVLGPHANFNFFFSPLDAKKEWGDADDWYAKLYNMSAQQARVCLANQFLSIDERRETILDGLKRLPIDIQEKIRKVPFFEVTAHIPMSLRESLLKDVHRYTDRFLLATMKYEPPGIIGAWCLQSLITWDRISKYELKPRVKVDFSGVTEPKTTVDYGLRDVHMGIGSQYANAKYGERMSMGDRITLEIKRGLKEKQLQEIVT